MAVAPEQSPSQTAPPPSQNPPSPPDTGDDKVLVSSIREDADSPEIDSAFADFDDSFLAGKVDGDASVPPASPASSVGTGTVPAVAAPAPQVAPALPPSAPGVAQVAQPTPAPVPATPPPAAAQPAPAESGAAPAAPADGRVAWTAWRDGAVNELAKSHFAMPDEHANLFESDPQKFVKEVLPRMAAGLYLDAVAAATSAIEAHLPQYISGQMTRESAEREAENEFWGAWKQLDRNTHSAVVTETGRLYRQFNPKATKADYIRDVGAQVVLRLGLPLQAQAAPPVAPQPPRVAPHVPLAASAPRVPAPAQSANPFDIGGSAGGGFGLDEDE